MKKRTKIAKEVKVPIRMLAYRDVSVALDTLFVKLIENKKILPLLAEDKVFVDRVREVVEKFRGHGFKV